MSDELAADDSEEIAGRAFGDHAIIVEDHFHGSP